MSLTSFIALQDVRAKLKTLRPKFTRKLKMPISVQPRSTRYQLVGTAFDYMLRFELQRRAPYAVSREWVAEQAPEIIWRKTNSGSTGMDLFAQADPKDYMPPELLAKRARLLVENAKTAFAAYLKLKDPNEANRTEIAGHAIRLAKLDSVIRAFKLEPSFEEAAPEDIQDLLELLAVVPFPELLLGKPLLLNPTFEQTSHIVGGADVDAICGDLLVDFKTTKNDEIDAVVLDQVLGYLLLARKQRLTDPTFPIINRVGLYFCRQGYLWSMGTDSWVSLPEFSEVEKWFFQRAEMEFTNQPNG